MRQLLTFIFLLFILSSCFEEDTMVPPHEPGDLEVGVAELTENYQYQVFYDLQSNSTLKQNLISKWDLGFETSDSGWHVILNTTKMMLAGNTGETDFETVVDKGDIEMNFDPSHGNLDSLAIGQWYSMEEDIPVSKKMVYVIDRGTDEDFNLVGEKKITFDFEDENSYRIRFANLDGSEENSMIIPKDTFVNFVCVSFENGIVDIEPNKQNWDLQFGKYSTLLYTDAGDPYPYLVTGVLINPHKVAAVRDTIHTFEEIDYAIAEKKEFSTKRDTIGYEWKDYDFDNGRYSVLPDKIYILKDTEGYFFKLRFIDYYNDTGEKGYPTFEFLRL